MHGYIFRSAFLPDPYWSPGSHTESKKCLFSLLYYPAASSSLLSSEREKEEETTKQS